MRRLSCLKRPTCRRQKERPIRGESKALPGRREFHCMKIQGKSIPEPQLQKGFHKALGQFPLCEHAVWDSVIHRYCGGIAQACGRTEMNSVPNLFPKFVTYFILSDILFLLDFNSFPGRRGMLPAGLGLGGLF